MEFGRGASLNTNIFTQYLGWLPQAGHIWWSGVRLAPQQGHWNYNCLWKRGSLWRRRSLLSTPVWRRRRTLARCQMLLLKHQKEGGMVGEQAGWEGCLHFNWCWRRREVCPNLVCSLSRRPMPGTLRGRSCCGCRRSLLPLCWGGGRLLWWRQTRRWTPTHWTRKRRGMLVLGLLLAIHPFSRRGALKLIMPLQLLFHQCKRRPPSSLLPRPPSCGPPAHHWRPSAHLHLVAWCLDTSGWCVATAYLGALLSCHSCDAKIV